MADKPKILILDIETKPALAYVWKLFDETIGLDQLVEPSRIICWAAKWHGKPEVFFRDDRSGSYSMLEPLHRLLNEADAVVTFHGDKFDLPKIMGEFLEVGLPPPPPITSIDLRKTVKKLGLQSNKLAFVVEFFKIGKKIKTDFTLWLGVMKGDLKSWAKMRRYNIRDVRETDKTYRKLRPYIVNHPFLGTGTGANRCSKCGSYSVQSRGTRRTKTMAIDRLYCKKCTGWTDGARRRIT